MKPKFRAWDTENNCFFKPTYEAYKGNLQEIVLSMSGSINIRTMSHILDHESTFPNRFILNQWTGLKDKNSKEIYEGDVFKESNSVGEIKYGDASFFIEWKIIKDFWSESLKHHAINGEVIGNIYENADLLKG